MDKKELKRILKQHKIWVESEGEEGDCANLEGANLQGANLQGANLYSVSLCGANLKGANLKEISLDGADLYCANLQGANLKGAVLYGAHLEDAKFSIEIRECITFRYSSVSKEQLPWLALHPKFAEWLPTLKIK